jgi:predicted PurR-regulated permease PerM
MNNTLKAILIVSSILLILSVILVGLGDALVPLVIAFGISYLIFPLVKKLEGKKIKRNYAVVTVFAVVLILLGVGLAIILPPLVSDTRLFFKELPSSSAKAIQKIESISSDLGYPVELSRDSVATYLKEHMSGFSGGILKSISDGLHSSFTGVTKWLIAILNLFLIPLFLFYVINDYEKIYDELKSFVPKSFLPQLKRYIALSDEVLSGYVRGQLMVAFVLAVLYATGLSVVGLRFGLLIGLISGIISIIPYAGFSLGFITAITFALANYTGVGPVIGIVIIFITVQVLEGIFITPKFVGDKVGLGPLSTILALIIGGNLFGLVGMVVAIPIAAIFKTIIKDLKSEYQQLGF